MSIMGAGHCAWKQSQEEKHHVLTVYKVKILVSKKSYKEKLLPDEIIIYLKNSRINSVPVRIGVLKSSRF